MKNDDDNAATVERLSCSDCKRVIEVYEWEEGTKRPRLLGSDGLLAYVEAPANGGPQIGDTILLYGASIGHPEVLGLPYRVLERNFMWLAGAPDVLSFSKMWISVRRIEFEEA